MQFDNAAGEARLRDLLDQCRMWKPMPDGSLVGEFPADAVRGVLNELDAMREALRSVGIFQSDEDDDRPWCVTLEPRGEEPADSLADALRRTMDAAENDGRRTVIDEMPAVLAWHQMGHVECDHATSTDTVGCACGAWRCEPQPTVGEAVARWAEHIVAVLNDPMCTPTARAGEDR